jgi:hypothetical protein
LFANGFEATASPYGWTGRTGTGLTTTTAGAITGTRSGTVSLTTSNNVVTDDTPTAETTFHASFLVRANGTAATTSTATVYQAYTGNGGTGTALLRVVLRHSAGGVQVGLATPTGTPASWGAVTTTAGQSTSVRVDVVGTAATLSVGGSQLAGTVTLPSAAGVGSVRLGAVTGAANLGSMLVDAYDSARDRLPS